MKHDNNVEIEKILVERIEVVDIVISKSVSSVLEFWVFLLLESYQFEF